MLKKKLREEYLKKRNELGQKKKKTFDNRICEKIISSEEYKKAECIAAFYPIGSEPDIKPILEDAMKNKTLVLPVCGRGGRMIFRKTESLSKLAPGVYNIPEPSEKDPECDLKSIDFMIVPGLVFDRSGYRIGYGGGYYDRIIPQLRDDCITCGVGYSFEIAESLPTEEFDVKIKKFVCEE